MDNKRAGVYSVGRIADGLNGIIFREQVSGAAGIDGHIEIYRPSYDTSRVLGVKVCSVGAAGGGDVYVCCGNNDDIIYWFQHSIPILIMAYDSASGKVFWEHLREDNINFIESGWSIDVPRAQVFNESAVPAIREIPSYSPNLSRLAVDRPWMDMIEGGDFKLFITAEENINRPTGRGTLKINITDAKGEKRHIYDWPFFINPDMPFVYRFPSLFPWAELTADKDFYDTHAEEEADGSLPLCAIRPWTTEAGEIAHFRLEMSLNELGRSFLNADKYICNAHYDRNKPTGSLGAMYEKGLKFKAAEIKN